MELTMQLVKMAFIDIYPKILHPGMKYHFQITGLKEEDRDFEGQSYYIINAQQFFK